jgi:hypothetical protein
MTEKLRSKMGDAAVKLAGKWNTRGAGTMEFLCDDKGKLLLHGDEYAASRWSIASPRRLTAWTS